MADEPPETQTEDAAPDNAELAGRVNALDSKVDKILEVLGRRKDDVHDDAAQHTQDRLDRPSTVAEEIRAQLEAQRTADAADAEKRGQADWRSGVDAKLAEMTEQAPDAPMRRVEKIMGWR